MARRSAHENKLHKLLKSKDDQIGLRAAIELSRIEDRQWRRKHGLPALGRPVGSVNSEEDKLMALVRRLEEGN